MAKDKIERYGRGTVNIPDGVKSSSCETRSQSSIVHTKHGTVKVIESVPVKGKP
jgi:hypothetical protein